MPKRKSKKHDSTVRTLAVIGAILSIIFGVLGIFGYGIIGVPIAFGLERVFTAAIVIIIGLIVLASYSVINISLKVNTHWITLLILGVISIIFGGDVGALLIIIAGLIAAVVQ
ncbi:MAG: hypothetical protein ACFFBS_02435 [Promethearchaeota archaeon]